MSVFERFPDRITLLEHHQSGEIHSPLKVNNHIHTPSSFSAFKSIDEAVQMARNEEVKVLGINDFYVIDGYKDFIRTCSDHGLFPLLNIELIGISEEDQAAGIRVNDPGNPGRTYISGKGLAFPSILPAAQQQKLDRVVKESNQQVAQMIGLLNSYLEEQKVDLSLSVEEVIEEHAMELLRERHVAKALRVKIEQMASSDDSFYHMLQKVYGGLASDKQRNDPAGLEDELRARLLKSGAPAFVPEDEKAFMKLEEIMLIIEDAGGIPTYPMLLDGAGEELTEFERDPKRLLEVLNSRGFRSVEMIPLRNKRSVLKEYAKYFYEQGFVISFGTEHNTTSLGPMTVACKDGALDESLMQISFNGAAYQAAHQYLVQKEGPDYQLGTREEMEQLGRTVLNEYFTTNAKNK